MQIIAAELVFGLIIQSCVTNVEAHAPTNSLYHLRSEDKLSFVQARHPPDISGQVYPVVLPFHFKRGLRERVAELSDRHESYIALVLIVVGLVLVLTAYWVYRLWSNQVSPPEPKEINATCSAKMCAVVHRNMNKMKRGSSSSSDIADSKGKAPEEPRSLLRLYIRIAMVYVACVLAPGVLPIWSVVQPLFAQAGVYGSRCTDASYGCEEQEEVLSFAYMIAFALMLTFLWPMGLLFDNIGAKSCSTIGALLCAAAQVHLSLAVIFPGSLSWLIYTGALFADFGAGMNGYALAGFLWHDPERQGFLTGLMDSSGSAGTLMALVGVTILPFRAALWTMAVTAVIAAVVCWWLAPSLEEYKEEAAKIWNLDGLREFAKQFGFRAAWRLAWKAIKEKAFGPKNEPSGLRFFTAKLGRCRQIFNANYDDNFYFTASLTALISYYSYFTSIQSPYLIELLSSEKDSEIICDFGASVYGIVGLVLAPTGGYVSDTLGLKALVVLVAILNCCQVGFCFIPSVFAQMIGGTTGAAFAALYITYATRWFVLYAPPEDFGNYLGAILSLVGLLSMVICGVLYILSALVFSGLSFYIVPLAIVGLGSVVSTNVFIWHISGQELPSVPPLVDDDVEEPPPKERTNATGTDGGPR